MPGTDGDLRTEDEAYVPKVGSAFGIMEDRTYGDFRVTFEVEMPAWCQACLCCKDVAQECGDILMRVDEVIRREGSQEDVERPGRLKVSLPVNQEGRGIPT